MRSIVNQRAALASTLTSESAKEEKQLRTCENEFGEVRIYRNGRRELQPTQASEGEAELAKSVKFSVSRKEATKSVRWMPRRQGPKKDAVHCEKPRGAVCRRRTGGIRMGKPSW